MTDTLGNWTLDSVVNTDALSLLRGLPDNSVNTCVTSPPYFGLRSYTDGDTREVGKEETPDAYVAALVEVFREVRRVLRDDGVLFLNLGDSYAGSGKGAWDKQAGQKEVYIPGITGNKIKSSTPGLKSKDLIGIPWMVAFALRADGWYLRSDIIWEKGNPMPESVGDRPTKSHEYVFLLTKSPRYFYDSAAIAEPIAETTIPRMLRGVSDNHKNVNGAPGQTPHSMNQPRQNAKKQDALGKRTYTGFNDRYFGQENLPQTRNKRTVWHINTTPFPGSHFAVMPEKLVEPCILAGCPETICAACGAPHERVVERERFDRTGDRLYGGTLGHNPSGKVPGSNTRGMPQPEVHDLGFSPTCTCNAGTAHGICIDIFGGAATVGVVAKRLNRRYLLSEINPAYVEIARDRLAGVTPMLAGFAAVQS